MEEKERRQYKMEDSKMRTAAEVMHEILSGTLADFTAKFPWFDATFLNNFQSDIEAAQHTWGDRGVVLQEAILTETLQNAMDESAKALFTLSTYAQLAYMNDPARRKAFKPEWTKMQGNAEEMLDALEQAYNLATQDPYKTDLLNKGYGAGAAAQLQTLADNIIAKTKPKGKAKKERVISTEDRIRLLNAVWEKMKIIKICARLVYRDDYAKRRVFNLYQQPKKTVTVVIIQVMNKGKGVTGATVVLVNAPKPRLTKGKKGKLQYTSVRMPDKIQGQASHPDFGKTEFTFPDIKKGKKNVLKVEIGE